ncbi:MAG: glycosyltransferase [Pseudomonadota bacterium]
MIVFCHLLNDNSGSPVVLRTVINTLSEVVGDCQLFIGSRGRGCLEHVDVPIRRYWYRRSRVRLVTLITFLVSQIALYRALSRAKVPVNATIYVNTLLPFGGALWGYFNNRRVVYHAHEVSISPAPLRWLLLKIAQMTADRVFYVSNDQHERLPIKGVKPVILPNPVATEIADRGAASPYAIQRTGAFEALMVCNPRDYKGVPELVQLARRFTGSNSVHFSLVLNGDEDEVARYLPPEKRPANVTVFARTNNPARFYAKADVVLNLSRVDQWIETFGLTIIEAMSFGVPVIVPPIGGPPEIVTDGKEGYLADSRNTNYLEELLSSMLNDPEKMIEMSQAARLRANDFGLERFAKTIKTEVLG